MSPLLCCQPLRSSLPPPQKHNFPIDYTVQVQYEEVLRPSNITRLRNGTVSEVALRYLWFHLSSQAVLRIREVLPEKHPSWRYTQEPGFDSRPMQQGLLFLTDVEVVVADLVKLVHSAGAESRRKGVRPKALLDNCLKVMRMLYGAPCDCLRCLFFLGCPSPSLGFAGGIFFPPPPTPIPCRGTPRATACQVASISFPSKKTSGFVCCTWRHGALEGLGAGRLPPLLPQLS
uniref:Interleukin 34 n=1 Tax=Calidris pygmaea TaxID=425635 RepID=A0A8C3KII9_9CHAR